jgi:hypothetical protein
MRPKSVEKIGSIRVKSFPQKNHRLAGVSMFPRDPRTVKIFLVEDDKYDLEREVNEDFNASDRHKTVESAHCEGRAGGEDCTEFFLALA